MKKIFCLLATLALGLSFDVTEEQVTFNPDAYPGVPVIDKR